MKRIDANPRPCWVARLAALLVTIAWSAGCVARAAPPPGPPGEELIERLSVLLEAIGVDEATQRAVAEKIAASRERTRDLRRELFETRGRLRELMEQDEPDRAAVLREVERAGELATRLHKERVSTLLEIRSLLTPEQRRRLRKLREGLRPRRGFGPPPPPGPPW